MVGIALDIQGSDQVKPWVNEACVTFRVLLDQFNVIRALYDPNVPCCILVDEESRLVRPNFSWIDLEVSEFRDELHTWIMSNTLPETWIEIDRHPRPYAWTAEQKKSDDCFRQAVGFINQGQRTKAVDTLRNALSLDPENYTIGHQLRVLEHPEDYYEGDMPAINPSPLDA